MEWFLQPKQKSIPSSSSSSGETSPATTSRAHKFLNNTKKSLTQFNMGDFVFDPGQSHLLSHMILISKIMLRWYT